MASPDILAQLQARKQASGLSLRSLAREMNVSPSLLSMTLAGQRNLTPELHRRIAAYLRTTAAEASPTAPEIVYSRFMAERQSYLRDGTVRFYRQKLEPFLEYLREHGIASVLDVQRHHISRFLEHIRNGRPRHATGGERQQLSQGALKLHHQTLKTFFNYVRDTMDTPKGWRHPVNGIKAKPSQAITMGYSPEEVSRMFQVVDSTPWHPMIRARNRAILFTLLNSAMRISELVAMRTNDVSADGRLKVRGKGQKDRVVSIGSEGAQAINDYLAERVRGLPSSPAYLWTALDGTALTDNGVRAVFRAIETTAPESFPEGVFAHRFRHTAITQLLRAGVPLRSVQRYAGHTSAQTTLRYAQSLDAEDAIESITDASPASRLLSP